MSRWLAGSPKSPGFDVQLGSLADMQGEVAKRSAFPLRADIPSLNWVVR